MKLNELSDNPGAHKRFKRVGRGIGSGKGKTAGRGVKGQKARSGANGIRQFEGGQMPLYMRLPKRGFNKPNRSRYVELNVGDLQEAVDSGALKARGKIDAATLVEAGVIRRALDGVRLLGSGELKAKLDLEVDYATAGARAAVEKAGGTVVMTRPARPAKEDAAPEAKAEAAPEPEKKPGKKKAASEE